MTASLKQRPPFRVEHVGSLIRPKPLLEKRALLEQGKCTRDDLKAEEDAACAHVVQLQQQLGLGTITDGEMRRAIYHEGVFDKMEGIVAGPRPLTEFSNYWPYVQILGSLGLKEFGSCYCTGKIKRTVPFFVEQFKALKALVPPEDVSRLKVNICPPGWFHQFHGPNQTYDKAVYSNDAEYFDDIAVAYRAEIAELYELGCRNIQFDDPTFCFFYSMTAMRAAGDDPDALLNTYIRAINLCTAGRPEEFLALNIGLHMCRGNYMGMHFDQGGYERVAEKIFTELDIDTYYLEYDDEGRCGSFHPLRYLPLNKMVVLGIVTTKRPELEDPEVLKARVLEAAEVLVAGSPPRSKEEALNQICISPQCGFASVWQGNPVTEEDIKAKIRVLQTVAKEIWE
ncbi:Methionine vitamin-b12 [Mycena chlorophos]|uniref:Methionine vitamin-b12 n=1 Tax=Mycena chlorophos TaxID=658473 RepID=A0A8H6T5N9_MYCCL|nr:Methionine vitamin-b12 [Mycena chlorophos]